VALLVRSAFLPMLLVLLRLLLLPLAFLRTPQVWLPPLALIPTWRALPLVPLVWLLPLLLVLPPLTLLPVLLLPQLLPPLLVLPPLALLLPPQLLLLLLPMLPPLLLSLPPVLSLLPLVPPPTQLMLSPLVVSARAVLRPRITPKRLIVICSWLRVRLLNPLPTAPLLRRLPLMSPLDIPGLLHLRAVFLRDLSRRASVLRLRAVL